MLGAKSGFVEGLRMIMSCGGREMIYCGECFSQFKHFSPTSLCGALVFGCALPSAPPPASRFPPSPSTKLTHNSLSHTQLTHTQITHTTYSHTQLSLTHTTYSHTHNFLTQAWHLWTSSILCAGVALGNIHLAWQAWHLVTSNFTLCGRRGTWRHQPSFCVAGVGWLW